MNMVFKSSVAEDICIKYSSPFCDFLYYHSSIDPDLNLAMRVLKPAKPSYILVNIHGWHMHVPEFEFMDKPKSDYLTVQVDMRGRKFSSGKSDCNSLELFDVIDAVNVVKNYYKDYIIDKDIIYFESESGGGGNGYALLTKFPDYFAAASVLCGISDYEMWYANDKEGEFTDEMDLWIGCKPKDNVMAYHARSSYYLLQNLYTPLFIAHGENDLRVPVEQARKFIHKANELGKSDIIQYYELKNVGNTDHWGNATEQEMDMVSKMSEANRKNHRKSVEIPDKGSFVVGGYLFTKKFSILLDSVDKMAVLEYDLKEKKFEVRSEVKCDFCIKWGDSGI